MNIKSLPFKINAALITTALLVAVLFIGLVYPLEVRRSNSQIDRVHLLLETIYRQKINELANEIFAKQQRAIHASLEEVEQVVEDITSACLYRQDGAVLFCSNEHAAYGDLAPDTLGHLRQNPSFFRKTTINGRNLAVYSHNIEIIGERIGYLAIYYDLERIFRENRTLFTLFWALFFAALILMVLLFNLFLYQAVINPVTLLNNAMHRVKQGNLGETVILPGKDEIGEMGTTFNDMSLNLLRNNKELEQHREQMEELVRERTKELLEAKEHAENAEDSLRHQRDILNILMETIPNPLFHKDIDGRYTGCNRAFETFIGKSKEEIIGKTVYDLAPKTIADRYQQKDQELFDNPGTQFYQWKAIRADGDVRDVFFNKATITNNAGTIVGLIGIISDITELVRTRQQAEIANRTKSKFLANMSHEIRTPMNGVIGMTTLLLDTRLDERQRTFVETIRTSGEALLKVINDILDFSKIEAGKLDLQSVDFSLRSLLDNLIDMMKVQAEEKQLGFSCAAAPEVPEHLNGDPDRLRQILINLTGNAFKFTKQGEITVTVTKFWEERDKVLLKFTVRDTGIGIPADKQSLLFQSFSQVDTSTTRKFGGTGLGLVISKQICEMMGGTIGFTSTPGAGSEFWFTIKLSVQHKPATAFPWHETLRGCHILVVDENATSRDMLMQQLGFWGAKATATDNLLTAKDILEQAAKPVPLIFMSALLYRQSAETLASFFRAKNDQQLTHLVLLNPIGYHQETKPQTSGTGLPQLFQPIRHADLIHTLSMALLGVDESTSTEDSADNTGIKQTGHNREHILLAEDNFSNQQVIIGTLNKLGYTRVDTVENGREVLTALARQPYNLVLMDLSMPELDGIEATRQVRSQTSGVLNHNIPIIALTAHAMRGDREKCLTAGMDDYITKPVDHEELARILALFLPSADPGTAHTPMSTPPDHPQIYEAGTLQGIDNTATTPANIDFQALVDRLMGDRELALTILSELEKELPIQLEQLKKYIDTGDCTAAASQAHKIKGAAGNVGAQNLCNQLIQLEDAGESGKLADLQDIFPRLMNEYVSVNRAIACLSRRLG